MKRLALALIFLVASTPALAAREISVVQLEELLQTSKRDSKTDAEVATALKQVELNEELTLGAMNRLMSLVPGPLTTEQMFILEASSADLTPPKTDLPGDPAPDAATQSGILDKAASYVAGVYDHLPAYTATKTTLRFQDNMETVAASSGLQGGARDVVTAPGFSHPATFIHYISSTEAKIASNRGVEKASSGKKKSNWGANGMISLEESDPNLGAVMKAAQASGTLKWLRWELVNGNKTAVFSFAVPENDARLAVNVCCFPKLDQTGVATFYSAATAGALGGGGTGGGVTGNFQTTTQWNSFKATPPYHGRIYVMPQSGIVLRLIVENEFKPTDFVHRLDTRIDYAPVKLGETVVVAPVKTIINTQVVPKGDSGAGSYTVRNTLFISEYKGYRPGKN
ncbi:MAG TPA: hypothetical protein VFI20_02855 [Terracidiphilus sp.]|nr:hypothetical protein [Terracidiphilus sp.]